MKTKIIYFFILIGLMVSFNSCGSEDESTLLTQTFLEKHEGTKWIGNDERIIYLKINNNLLNPIDLWITESRYYWLLFSFISYQRHAEWNWYYHYSQTNPTLFRI